MDDEIPEVEVCINAGGEALLVLLRERVPEVEWVPLIKVGDCDYRRKID